MFTLPVFYHPSTIVTVDDDVLFLKAISQLIKSKFKIKTFQEPTTCIDFLDTYVSPLSETVFLRPCKEYEHYDSLTSSLVDFDASGLYSLKQNSCRFDEISILIVDYNMPEMNGIELCQKISALPIKKILLTGQADNRDAVDAFNNKIIDCFMRKDSPTLVADIQSYVARLSREYFHQRTSALMAHLEVDQPIPLSDPIFTQFFDEWCQENSIREYTLIDKNGSLLVIDDNDQHAFLVVHTERTLRSFAEVNDDVAEAELLLSDVKKFRKIPFFGVGKESWQFSPDKWAQFFFKPNVLAGRENYYWAVSKQIME
ncbi:MAG: response regulator [Gammaproteobacteria bacterium]